jgi:predicted nucleic acid-binding protein
VTAYFLDSSAVIKLYTIERGSSWLVGQVDPNRANLLCVSQITAVEVASALHRRARHGDLALAFAQQAVARLRVDLSTAFLVIDVGRTLIDDAIDVAERRGHRGYDCVQLAAAGVIAQARRDAGESPVVILSADDELNQAAEAEGFTVENPNDYP